MYSRCRRCNPFNLIWHHSSSLGKNVSSPSICRSGAASPSPPSPSVSASSSSVQSEMRSPLCRNEEAPVELAAAAKGAEAGGQGCREAALPVDSQVVPVAEVHSDWYEQAPAAFGVEEAAVVTVEAAVAT